MAAAKCGYLEKGLVVKENKVSTTQTCTFQQVGAQNSSDKCLVCLPNTASLNEWMAAAQTRHLFVIF